MSSSRGLSKGGEQAGPVPAWRPLRSKRLTGCNTGATTDFRKGFLDPTAVGRYQKQPLVVPILSSLDRSVDVADDRFRNATDVTARGLNPPATTTRSAATT